MKSAEMTVPGPSSVLLWDDDSPFSRGDWQTVLWREFSPTPSTRAVSLAELVEEGAHRYRRRLLRWIHDLGQSQTRGKKLVDRLELRPGFSYWWMTLLVENGYGKSTRLFDAVKLFALEEFCAAHAVSDLFLATRDRPLALAIASWCERAGIVLHRHPLPKLVKTQVPSHALYASLPPPIRGLASLLKAVFERRSLRKAGDSVRPPSDVVFADYLSYIDRGALRAGQFRSHWWGPLERLLSQSQTPVRWMHHYVADSSVPAASDAADIIDLLNRRDRAQTHTILDASAGWPVLAAALRDYARVMLRAVAARDVRPHFTPTQSRLDFWPLFSADWRESVYGPVAAINCLYLNLFEKILSEVPAQRLGLYLQENQAWEMAFIHAWKSAGHGQLVGVPHATVRFWDLRYFHDPISYERTGNNDLPLPDMIAVNGPAAKNAYREWGFPEERLVEVEALRFLYLLDVVEAANDEQFSARIPATVLVLGDYMPAATALQLKWLEEASRAASEPRRYLVKPHPHCPIRSSDYPSLNMEVTTAELGQLLEECAVAYVSNITSAAVDAYVAGVPVISVLDPAGFDLSPLRGLEGVTYIRNPGELSAALAAAMPGRRARPEIYFHLDRALPRWQRLLGLNLSGA